MHITPPKAQTITEIDRTFDDLRALVNRTLESAGSARIYQQTFDLWVDWCHNHHQQPFDMTPGNVWEFLDSQDTTKTTRQRQLSAMRKLAQLLTVLDGEEARRLYEGLKILKTPPAKGSGKERPKRALSPAEVDKLLRIWDETTLTSQRNRAIIAVLFFTGIRRAELAALRWDDVDLDRAVIHIRHGKGDKARDVSIIADYAVKALKDWRTSQGKGREFVFCTMSRGSHAGHLTADRAIDTQTVYRVVKATERQSGVVFKPHDARRTFITEALSTGTPLPIVQAQAGHARGDTTLAYAQSVDAEKRRDAFRVRYG